MGPHSVSRNQLPASTVQERRFCSLQRCLVLMPMEKTWHKVASKITSVTPLSQTTGFVILSTSPGGRSATQLQCSFVAADISPLHLFQHKLNCVQQGMCQMPQCPLPSGSRSCNDAKCFMCSRRGSWNYLTVQLARTSENEDGDPDLYGLFTGGNSGQVRLPCIF